MVTACEETFDSINDLWESILPKSNFNSCFLGPHIQRIWWDQFGEDAELCLQQICSDGELRGIAPLMHKDGVYSFVGETDLFDYHDFVVLQGMDQEFYTAFMKDMESREWSSMVLSCIPEGSPTLEQLASLARASGHTVEIEKEDMTLGLALPDSWDGYLALLNRKDRHELRRKMRRLDNNGDVKQYYIDSPEALDESLPDFFRLMKASAERKAQFMTQKREVFFQTTAKHMASMGNLRLYFLEINGLKVATALCFDYGNRLLLYNSGYDPEYASLSVGLLNKALSIKEAIEGGMEFFDFLKGTEPYKFDLGGMATPIYQMVVHRRG